MLKEETKNIFVIILGLFVVVLIFSTLVDVKNKIEKPENTMTFSGTGTIYVKPDLAQVSASVVSDAKTVAEAMTDNTGKMNAVISFVKGQGIEDRDLKTTNFSIYPRYEYQKVETQIYPYPPGKRVLVGYEITQSLEIKIRDMSKVGTIFEGVTGAGANEVSNLQFTVDQEDAIKDQARTEAINDAKSKAETLAKQLGIKLIKISNFSENSILPYFYSLKEAAPLGLGGGTTVPSIQTGENKIEVQVSITYDTN